MSKKPNIRERALFFISPEKGNRAYSERLKREAAAESPDRTGRSGPKQSATYYGNHGASRTLNSMIGWMVGEGGTEDGIDVHGTLLRKRSRDLFAGGGLARSGPTTLTTNVVGWGISPKPKIDSKFLGMSEEERDEWEENALREFHLWADSPMCDAERQQNFFGLQWLAFISSLVSGDIFSLFGMKENQRTPYQTTIRLLEADRIATEDSDGESTVKELDGGGRVVDGVELDKEGAVVAYWVANRQPAAQEDGRDLTYKRIEAFGKDTGYPNMLHVMTWERPEQRRGVPFVAACIENLKQFDRYLTAELAAQVVASMLTAFIINKEDGAGTGLEDALSEDEKVSDDELHLELRPGAIYDLPPGKSVETVNPLRNNTAFESFVTTFETIIGSGFGIPKEVLIHKYDSNYTAARSALLDFWKTVRVYRGQFNQQFNQPIWEAFLAEAVATGRIEAPGFFEDPAIRKAWSGCIWTGVTMGHVDPKKEVEAAILRIMHNLSTEEQEAAEYNGNSWTENVRQRKKEAAETAELNAMTARQENGETFPDDKDDEDKEDEE